MQIYDSQDLENKYMKSAKTQRKLKNAPTEKCDFPIFTLRAQWIHSMP